MRVRAMLLVIAAIVGVWPSALAEAGKRDLQGFQGPDRIFAPSHFEASLGFNEVRVTNRSGKSLAFSLRSGGGRWTEFSLPAGWTGTYTNADEVRISTRGRPEKVYSLCRQCRFQLSWDNREDLWNVFTDPLQTGS